MDVAILTNDELSHALRSYIDVGPVTDSTRKVYQRKLQRILQEQSEAEVVQNTSVELNYEEYSEHDEDEEEYEIIPQKSSEVQPTYIETEPTYSAPVSSYEPLRRRELHTDTAELFRPSSSMHRDEVDFQQSEKLQAPTPTSVQKSAETKKKNGGLSIWLQLIIIAVIGIIIFLIFQNMEPANTNPIGKIDSNV